MTMLLVLQFPEAPRKRASWQATHESFYPEHKKDLTIEDVVKKHVLPFLPAKSLCRFKAVCKAWKEWISNPFFLYRQSYCFQETCGFLYQCPDTFPVFISLDSSAYGVACPSLNFLPEYVIVRATCNGLICCRGTSGDNSYYICNPANRQWHVIPEPNLYHGPESVLVLAHEPSLLNFTASYELVCAIPMINEPVVRFEIFSSRSRTWRVVDTVCSDLISTNFCGDGLYIKGYACWETYCGEVLAFDMRYELYSIFPLPANRGPEGVLTECRGELCYVMPYKLDNNECLLEVYGGMCMGLKHAISFPVGNSVNQDDDEEEEECFRALPCLSGDRFAVLAGWNLVVYDVKENSAESLDLRSIYEGGKFLPYVNSLLPVSHHQMYREIRNVSAQL
ncbi:F-box protein At5g49610-like isoform X2 [Neltuma alba]|uniref:F-box protein At5g49610-like isoform X2 n=1 Tax=Neltuma alba TaxID=207710 RepID=UPI0010A47BE9|nr:F-box protein At5g49610-like isoform X2 [Prosopis alba]